MEQLSLFDFWDNEPKSISRTLFATEYGEELRRTMARAVIEFYTTEEDAHDDSRQE